MIQGLFGQASRCPLNSNGKNGILYFGLQTNDYYFCCFDKYPERIDDTDNAIPPPSVSL